MKHCKKCLLPQSYPGADIDVHGICNFCRNKDKKDDLYSPDKLKIRQDDLAQAIANAKGVGPYDALVALSGGKDSIYLLYKLKVEMGLRVLAMTTDMNLPDIAWDNIRRTVDKLDVDLVTIRPERDFYRRMFTYLLKNQEGGGAVRTVCYVCAPLFESDAIRLATDRGIPLVLAAYAPGQPEPERMLYEFSRKMIENFDWTPPELKNSGLFSPRELERFWNPHAYPQGTKFPRYLAPFHAWEYSQEEVMKKVVELGLIIDSKHANPIHSNCPVNWLLMYSDLKNLGYNPYNPEFSNLIRSGKANLTYWKFALPVVNFMIRNQLLLGKNVKKTFDWLGITASDLKITRQAGTIGVDPSLKRG